MWWWIGAAVAVIVIASVAWLVMKPPPNVGNQAKFERTFSAAEQQRLDTVTVSRQELSEATCEQGQHCWIAVKGVVYDMGVFPSWARGEHHGVKAGQDDTDKFLKSGHGVAYLQKMPVVGRLEE